MGFLYIQVGIISPLTSTFDFTSFTSGYRNEVETTEVFKGLIVKFTFPLYNHRTCVLFIKSEDSTTKVTIKV